MNGIPDMTEQVRAAKQFIDLGQLKKEGKLMLIPGEADFLNTVRWDMCERLLTGFEIQEIDFIWARNKWKRKRMWENLKKKVDKVKIVV